MKFASVLLLSSLFALLVLAGCEEDRMFAECSFDDELKAACSLQDETTCTNFNCHVADHPTCVDKICLAYEGAEPRCTKECVPEDDDCPGGSRCTLYAYEGKREKHACVKVEDQERLLFVSCEADPNVCDEVGADVCLPIPSLGKMCSQQCANPCLEPQTCSEYNGTFHCMKSCRDGAGLCAPDERCITYGDDAYCFASCEQGTDGCAEKDDLFYELPNTNSACNPHQGCPGRAFCQAWKDQGYFCVPCEYAAGQF